MFEKAIEKILNIGAHELPRTAYAWCIRFLYRAGFIIGWTALVAIFVARFGIAWLPLLFLIQAVLTICGMVIFSFLMDRFKTSTLIGICAFGAGIFLFSSIFFINSNFPFFALLFVVIGIFIPQLTIMMAHYIEDFFTPMEAERIYPVLESAETIGGIFGGIVLGVFTSMIASYKFFYLWIFFLFLFSCVIFFLRPGVASYHHVFHVLRPEKFNLRLSFEKIKKNISQIKIFPYLRGLLLVIVLYWIVANLLEFQFTKMVDENLAAHGNEQSHADNLASGLGSLQIIFHASALLVQLLLASRILRKFGTVAGFLLHALMTFFSAVSLLFGFNYFTILLAKNNFELTGIVHKNAYEGSYYAISHSVAKHLRQFFEAFIYPVGTIFATLFLLGLNFFFLEKHIFPILQLIMVFLAFLMVIVTLRLQESYTSVSKKHLLESEHKLSKLHAVEILSQKGHHNVLSTFISALKKPGQTGEIKAKILATMGQFRNQSALPVIISFLNDSEPSVSAAAVKALSSFKNLKTFSRHCVIEELKNLFIKTNHESIRAKIIETLMALQYEDIVNFLMNIMQNASAPLKVASIRASASFGDQMASSYIEPFLKDKNYFVKAEAILALWKLKYNHKRLKQLIQIMLRSVRREELTAVCSILGDINDFGFKQSLIPYLTFMDPRLRLYAAIALLKLGYKEAGNYLAHLLFSKNSVVLNLAKDLLFDLKPELKRHINKLIHREISFSMHRAFHKKIANKELLTRFRDAYLCIDAYNEADAIDEIINGTYNSKDIIPTLVPAFAEVNQ